MFSLKLISVEKFFLDLAKLKIVSKLRNIVFVTIYCDALFYDTIRN